MQVKGIGFLVVAISLIATASAACPSITFSPVAAVVASGTTVTVSIGLSASDAVWTFCLPGNLGSPSRTGAGNIALDLTTWKGYGSITATMTTPTPARFGESSCPDITATIPVLATGGSTHIQTQCGTSNAGWAHSLPAGPADASTVVLAPSPIACASGFQTQGSALCVSLNPNLKTKVLDRANQGGFAQLPSISVADFTVEFWIKATLSQYAYPIFVDSFDITCNVDGSIYVEQIPGRAGGTADRYYARTAVGGVTAGVWHHVAVTMSGEGTTGMAIYIDGNSVWTTAQTLTLTNPSGTYHSNILGDLPVDNGQTTGQNNGPTGHFQMDALRIWSIARSQSDIQSTMSQEIAGAASNLYGSWNFNNPGSSTLTDDSGNGRHATLTGSISQLSV